jgi:signal-transduction protein with cAMP-binding, CBS, and nucleotidyltransferase domain
MVQQLTPLEQFQPLLEKALGHTLSEKTVSQLQSQLEIFESPPSKPFWHSETAEPGLYVIVSGRVRLVDGDRNYLATLEVGQAFGELTLFPTDGLSPYSARSTQESATLLFLSKRCLDILFQEHPTIHTAFHQQAVQRDSQYRSLSTNIPTQRISSPSRERVPQSSSNSSPRKQPPKSSRQTYWPSPNLRVGHLWQRVTRRYPFYAQQSASDCGGLSGDGSAILGAAV